MVLATSGPPPIAAGLRSREVDAQDTGIGEIDGAGPVLFSAQRFDVKRNNLTLKNEQAVRTVRIRSEFTDVIRAEIELQGSKLPTKCKRTAIDTPRGRAYIVSLPVNLDRHSLPRMSRFGFRLVITGLRRIRQNLKEACDEAQGDRWSSLRLGSRFDAHDQRAARWAGSG